MLPGLDFRHWLGVRRSRFAGGIQPPECKLTASRPIEECPASPVYILPVKQHIGQPCMPCVSVGERVLQGQMLARAEGYVSVPIHAPVSGKVIKIEEHRVPHPSGLGMPCIFIEPDGSNDVDDSLEPMPDWSMRDPAELRERIRLAGLAGLGGAVFPTFIKMNRDQHHPIRTVILNGVECEPYLTNDHRLMLEHAQELIAGLRLIMHMVDAVEGIIAVEDNKPDVIEQMQHLLQQQDAGGMRVAVLPTRYPQGSEKQLIQSLTGREVPAGRLPMHVGVLCQNVGTVKAAYDAVVHGRPLIERVVTVSGDAVPHPGNLRVRLGTPFRFIFAQRGLENFDGVQIVHGGPMMGERLPAVDVPVVKSSIGLLAMQEKNMPVWRSIEDPCIRCGHCSEVCPIGLVPNLLADHCRHDHFEQAEAYDLFDCIECGCCSYVCPSHIPLVHYFRYGKGQLAQIRRERQFAEISRQRSEARKLRIEREEALKAARRARVRQEHAPASTNGDQDKPGADDGGKPGA